MVTSQYFFATPFEQMESMREFERNREIRYHLTGLFDDDAAEGYASVASIPGFARSIEGEHIRLPEFLILESHERLTMRAVPQRRGGIKYAVDGVLNPSGIAVRFSSEYSANILIYGALVPWTDPRSSALSSAFRDQLFEGFRRVKSFLVSPGAIEFARSGGRLAPDAFADPRLDLKI